MTTILFLIALIGIESAALAFAAWQKSPGYLRMLMVLQMVLVALFAPKLFDIAGFQSNVASVFYATVFTAQLVVARRWELKFAQENVWQILGIMLIFYALVGTLGAMPATDHDRVFTSVLSELTALSPRNALISLIAFVCGQFVLLATLKKCPAWWGAPLAILLGQAVDSAIFYPAVFQKMPFAVMSQIAIDGFITKIAVAAALAPAYLLAVCKHSDDYTTRIDRLHERAAARRKGRYEK